MSVMMDIIREEMQAIAKTTGELTPDSVVDAARNPNSAMHSQFEWDDTEAAASYRLSQARALIKRVKVTVIRPDKEVVNVPIFTRAPEGKGYVDTRTVMVNVYDRSTILIMALTQCSTILKNLASPEVDDIVYRINQLKSQLQTRLEKAS